MYRKLKTMMRPKTKSGIEMRIMMEMDLKMWVATKVKCKLMISPSIEVMKAMESAKKKQMRFRKLAFKLKEKR